MKVAVDDGTRLFVDVVGPGVVARHGELVDRPSFVMLHGGPGYDHSNLRRFHMPLARAAQLVFFDQRGRGRSDRSVPGNWTLARWADDVKSLCDALGIQKPIVMGASFGGMVAQTYAARHPDHPRALVLHSTAARFNYDRIIARMAALGGAEARAAAVALWEDPGDPERLARYTEHCMRYYTVGTPAPDPRRVAVEVNLEVLRYFYAPGREGRTMDLTATNKAITCDTLVIAGVDDPITVIEEADALVDSLCNARVDYLRVERAGHGVHHDHPDLIRHRLKQFIKDHP